MTPTRILAIDPGSERSAWLELGFDGRPAAFAIEPNEEVLDHLRYRVTRYDVVVIEQVESYGMAVGREVFATVHWAGRFTEAAHLTTVVQLPRRRVKVALCGDTRAKDQNIRLALVDRFGGPSAIRKGGPLYGVVRDIWSALAIAITYQEESR